MLSHSALSSCNSDTVELGQLGKLKNYIRFAIPDKTYI